MSYDNWKATNPDDEFLGEPPCEDCRMTPDSCGCCNCGACEKHYALSVYRGIGDSK